MRFVARSCCRRGIHARCGDWPEAEGNTESATRPRPAVRRAGQMVCAIHPYARSSQPAVQVLGASCTLPDELQTEKVHTYNISDHPLVDLIAVAVGAEDRATLCDLHLTGRSREFLEQGRKLGTTPIDTAFKASGGCRFNVKLRECYLRFLREVIMPLVPDSRGILYQREPNLRCHYPGTGRQLVLRHCDADYHHQPNEINFCACQPPERVVSPIIMTTFHSRLLTLSLSDSALLARC